MRSIRVATSVRGAALGGLAGEGSPLPPDLSAAQAARVLSAARFEAVRRCAQSVAQAPDGEAIHDLRVALRRLRAALELFAAPEHLVHEVKALAAILGRCRDAQLRAEWLAKAGDRAAGGVLRATEALRLRASSAAAKAAVARWLARPSNVLDRELRQLAPHGRFDGHRLRKRLRSLAKAVERSRDRLDAPPSARQAHRLRIRVKKLRYAAEILEAAHPESLGKALPPLRALQTLLGNLHDADVRVAWLKQIESLPGTGVSQLLTRAQLERTRLAKQVTRVLVHPHGTPASLRS